MVAGQRCHTSSLLHMCCTAVRQLLETLQHELGYSSICLFADKDKPHIGTMYQVSSVRPFGGLSAFGLGYLQGMYERMPRVCVSVSKALTPVITSRGDR